MSRSWLFLIGPFIQSAANIDENWRKRSGALIALRVTMCGTRATAPFHRTCFSLAASFLRCRSDRFCGEAERFLGRTGVGKSFVASAILQ